MDVFDLHDGRAVYYYFNHMGIRTGPVSAATLKQKLRIKEIHQHTRVRNGITINHWTEIRNARELKIIMLPDIPNVNQMKRDSILFNQDKKTNLAQCFKLTMNDASQNKAISKNNLVCFNTSTALATTLGSDCIQVLQSILCPPTLSSNKLRVLCRGYMRLKWNEFNYDSSIDIKTDINQENKDNDNDNDNGNDSYNYNYSSRQYKHINFIDIASIVIQMIGINIFVQFGIHGASSVEDKEKMNLNDLISSSHQFQKKKKDQGDHNYHLLVFKNYNKINYKHQSQLSIMTVGQMNCDNTEQHQKYRSRCSKILFDHGGFALQCGIIGIHKSVDRLFNNLFNYETSNMHYCNLFNVMNKHKKFESKILSQVKQDFGESGDVDYNSSDKTTDKTSAIKPNLRGYSDEDNSKHDKANNIKQLAPIQTYYLYFWKYYASGDFSYRMHFVNRHKIAHDYKCAFGMNEHWEHTSLYDNKYGCDANYRDIAIDDSVRLKNGLTGKVKFKGTIVKYTSNRRRIRVTPGGIGIELDEDCLDVSGAMEKNLGGSDGCINGEKYFECKKGLGYFTIEDDIIDINNFNNYRLENGETVSVCVDSSKQSLYFVKNNQFAKGSDSKNAKYKKTRRLGGVEQKLDFVNYNYYFAISSPFCDCKGTTGFEFNVTISV